MVDFRPVLAHKDGRELWGVPWLLLFQSQVSVVELDISCQVSEQFLRVSPLTEVVCELSDCLPEGGFVRACSQGSGELSFHCSFEIGLRVGRVVGQVLELVCWFKVYPRVKPAGCCESRPLVDLQIQKDGTLVGNFPSEFEGRVAGVELVEELLQRW